MKYMVWVNQKFLVTVETDGSACAAEHEILDNYQGIVSAQAFDRDSMKTDVFAGAVLWSETISRDDLKAMSDRYENAYIELSKAMDEEREIVDEIERLQAKIKDLQTALSPKHQATMKAKLHARNAKVAMNCNE